MPLPAVGDIAIVVAGALAAGFVNGLSGTGYALVALGFWLQAMSPLTAAPLTALCSVAGHVQSLPRIWSGVRWPRLWPFLAAGIVGVPIGTLMLDHVQPQPLKAGRRTPADLLQRLDGLRAPPTHRHRRRPPGRCRGRLHGWRHGRHGEPQRASSHHLGAACAASDKDEQRGVNQPFNMSVLFLALVSAGIAGFLDRTFFVWAAVTVPTTLIGARLGLMLYGRIGDAGFRRIVLVLLGLSGATLIASSLR